MGNPVTITLPDGRSWTPKFVHAINEDKCIGCGRCFRVCGRDVLQLKGAEGSQRAPNSCTPAPGK